MAWDDPSTHPAGDAVTHPNGATGFARLVVATPDMGAALHWLGGRAPGGVVLQVGRGGGVVSLHIASVSEDIPVT